MSHTILLDVHEPVYAFLKAIDAGPPGRHFNHIDLDSVVSTLVDSMATPHDPRNDLNTIELIAADIAYNDLLFNGPDDADYGLTNEDRMRIYEALSVLGRKLRDQLMNYKLYRSGHGFNYIFKEIERDRFLFLEQDDSVHRG